MKSTYPTVMAAVNDQRSSSAAIKYCWHFRDATEVCNHDAINVLSLQANKHELTIQFDTSWVIVS